MRDEGLGTTGEGRGLRRDGVEGRRDEEGKMRKER